MKNVVANARFWLGGIAAAIVGIVVARLVAPAVPPGSVRVTVTVAGQLLSLAGLALICFGVSRRVRRGADDLPPPAS